MKLAGGVKHQIRIILLVVVVVVLDFKPGVSDDAGLCSCCSGNRCHVVMAIIYLEEQKERKTQTWLGDVKFDLTSTRLGFFV